MGEPFEFMFKRESDYKRSKDDVFMKVWEHYDECLGHQTQTFSRIILSKNSHLHRVNCLLWRSTTCVHCLSALIAEECNRGM